MAEDSLKTYRGNCHCGRFVYEVEVPEIKGYEECNCSICHKKGYAWLFPRRDQLRFVKGSVDDLAVYTFGNGDFSHRFCSACGTAVMSDNPKATPSLYVNVRAIQGLDVWSLNVKTFDGKSLPPPREPPVYDGPEPTAEVENGRIYHGSCHCGAVTLALRIKPLETYDISKNGESIVECNCSICMRGGYVWIYPRKDQSVVQGSENLSYYVFGHRVTHKAFCKHCGVHMFNEPNPLITDKEIEDLSEAARARRNRLINNRNINLRILDDFDCSTLKTLRLDGRDQIKFDYINP